MTAPTSRREWSRRMWRRALVLMPLGLALLIVGSLLGWGASAMTGFLVGAVGSCLLVGGALCAKFAAAGPYPPHLPEEDAA